MDISVRTGSTKPQHDVALVSLNLETLQGERVFVLVEITAPEKEAHAIERECEVIVKHALLDSEGDPAERLDGTLKELNGLLKGMLVTGAVHDVHMLISILDTNGTLHVSHAGRAEAYLIRHSATSQITEYTAGKPTPAFVHIASGNLEDGDIVILSTQRLLRTFTPAQLARLTSDKDAILDTVIRALEGEQEHAALASVAVFGDAVVAEEVEEEPAPRAARASVPDRRRRMQENSLMARFGSSASRIPLPSFASIASFASGLTKSVGSAGKKASKNAPHVSFDPQIFVRAWESTQAFAKNFAADLTHPQRKKRAHLLLLAGTLAVLVIVWAGVHVVTGSQRSKTRAELEKIVEDISAELQLAENRRLTGDMAGANANLQHAREQALQLRDNEAGLFRPEANDLLERIRAKDDQINNVIRLTPRTIPLTTNNPDILARGLIGLGNSEFTVFDKQNAYRVLLKSVEQGNRLSDDLLVVDGANMERFASQVFLMNGNSLVELTGGQPVSMKTDDPQGWMSGVAIDAYLRFVYVLSPENKQIYKYERLAGKYSVPVEYNVNGDLTGAIDMTIDGSVFVLKDLGDSKSILKLFRGETQPFVIRGGPDDLLSNVTKIFKVVDRNIYLLDPVDRSVVVVSDGGATGEAAYVRKFVLEAAEDQDDTLQDLYVDADESQLFVLGEKRIYVIDLTSAR